MMKTIGYAGVYYGETMTVGATLEDPQKFNLDANTLVFIVTAEARGCIDTIPQMEDLKFYIMDEHDQMHSTDMMSHPSESSINADDAETETAKNTSCALIYTTLHPEFIFQDLRMVVYFKNRERMGIIKLQH